MSLNKTVDLYLLRSSMLAVKFPKRCKYNLSVFEQRQGSAVQFVLSLRPTKRIKKRKDVSSHSLCPCIVVIEIPCCSVSFRSHVLCICCSLPYFSSYFSLTSSVSFPLLLLCPHPFSHFLFQPFNLFFFILFFLFCLSLSH